MEPQCGCKDRYRAMGDGDFILSFELGGWVFANGPWRRMTPKAAYLGSERGVENHTGERFVFVCCPWCGKDLPPPNTDVIWRIINGEGDE